jgi:PKD repeat protein
MVDRISSLDAGYTTGDLSIYPAALDSKDTLFEVKNNAQTILKQSLPFLGKQLIVEDASGFPSQGLLRIGPPPGEPGNSELLYYDKKTNTSFQDLKRAYAGSVQSLWPKGAYVTNSVMAEHHNAIKDAIINVEDNLGVKENPTPESLNGILKSQETRFLTPKPLFRSFPLKGQPPLKVRFQNFSTGHLVRHFWDFGDGSVSTETSPTHTYAVEGLYTVQLNIMTSTGGQGVVTKTDYILVNEDETIPFYYISPVTGISSKTASLTASLPTEFKFVDQSNGEIVQRNWIFGDGTRETQEDPDIHTTSPIYNEPGSYDPVVILIFSTGRLTRVGLPDPLVVT